MKKLLFLLLFIPTLSYSQITYNEVMSINSEKTFKRVVIENGYESNSDEDGRISYGLNIVRDSIEENKSSRWAGYDKNSSEFRFKFYRISQLNLFGNEIVVDTPYDEIVKDIKKNCEFYDIINRKGTDYVCYSCSQSTYKGKIGFVISEGSGIIRHIIPKQPITYKDIMSINSVKTFNKVMIENGYEFNDEDEDWIDYGINILRDSIKGVYSSEWGVYDKTDDEFYFKFDFDKDYDDQFYNIIIDDIKKNCTFYDTLKNIGHSKRDYISYSCSESTYKGKIGYSITDSVSLIKHIIPTIK